MDNHAEHMLKIQCQVRQNQQDLSDFVNELGAWEEDMKANDKQRALKESDEKILPPVRNIRHQEKKKKKQNVQKDKPKRIPGYDFKAWDKFDVEKALEEIDGKEDKTSSSSEYETDEEWREEKKKQEALNVKDRGNALFKKGEYDRAIECYTTAIELDPTNAVLPANRAMALLKLQKFAAAEADATTSLTLDPLYVKAYLRRGQARVALCKYAEAKSDYQRVTDLEPDNKMAPRQLEQINERLSTCHAGDGDSDVVSGGRVRAIHKPKEARSKKPLYRVTIEEIGVDEKDAKGNDSVKRELTETRKLMEKEERSFAKIFQGIRADENVESSSVSTDQTSLKAETTNVSEGLVDVTNQTSEINNQSNRPINSTCRSIVIAESTNQSDDPAETVSRRSNNLYNTTDQSLSAVVITKPSAHVTKAEYNIPILRPRKTSDVPFEMPLIPPVPQTSFQFEADWKKLRSNEAVFYRYFKEIPPCNYCRLFNECLQVDMLSSVFRVLLNFYIRDGVEVYSVLEKLAKVKRFSVIIMFLSASDRSLLKQIFLADHDSSHYDHARHEQLRLAYGVS